MVDLELVEHVDHGLELHVGIGVQPPDASLGLMLSDAQAFLFLAPGYALRVGAVMVLMILSFALLSDGFSEVRNA